MKQQDKEQGRKIIRGWRALAAAMALGVGAVLGGGIVPAEAAPAGIAQDAQASVHETGSLHGYVYTHGSERGMKIASAPDASAGGVSWDLAAPRHKFHDKPADVWLIAAGYDIEQLGDEAAEAWYRTGEPPAGTPIYHTKTDKEGKYAFEGLPAGTYFLVIIDSYGRDAAQNLTELDAKQQLFARLPSVEEFEMYLVGSRSCLVQKAVLKPGETLEIKPGVL